MQNRTHACVNTEFSLSIFNNLHRIYRVVTQLVINTTENNFDLNVDDLERFIVIIMITIINSRKQQSDYWSNKRLLQSPIIKNLMPREKFVKIKKYITFYKLEDEDRDEKVWKVRHLQLMKLW